MTASDPSGSPPASSMDRRAFIKRAAKVAWVAPVIITAAPAVASAAPKRGSCVPPGQPCVPGGLPCCLPNQQCRPVDHGRFKCVGPPP